MDAYERLHHGVWKLRSDAADAGMRSTQARMDAILEGMPAPSEVSAQVRAVRDENEALRAEVEGLTKACDALMEDLHDADDARRLSVSGFKNRLLNMRNLLYRTEQANRALKRKVKAIQRRLERERREHEECRLFAGITDFNASQTDRWLCKLAGERDADAAKEAIEKRLMPAGIEWPRFEEGEPVMLGDTVLSTSGDTFSVYEIRLEASGYATVRSYGNHMSANSVDGFKRPPVIAADGRPIEVGETVWHEDGSMLRVVSIEHGTDEDGETLIKVETISGNDWNEVRSLSVSHENPEPEDSWERLTADACKYSSDYWGCYANCSHCPSKIDGKTPCEHYGCDDCVEARGFDIVYRAKRLAGLGGGE